MTKKISYWNRTGVSSSCIYDRMYRLYTLIQISFSVAVKYFSSRAPPVWFLKEAAYRDGDFMRNITFSPHFWGTLVLPKTARKQPARAAACLAGRYVATGGSHKIWHFSRKGELCWIRTISALGSRTAKASCIEIIPSCLPQVLSVRPNYSLLS